MHAKIFSSRKSPKNIKSGSPKPTILPGRAVKCLTPAPESIFNIKKSASAKIGLNLIPIKLKGPVKLIDSSTIKKSQIKALEEIGLFSDWQHSKKIYKDDSENSSSRHTIHITDFMKQTQKVKLTKIAELSSAYEAKKRSYRNNFYTMENCIRNFMTHGEKMPGFFSTPQVSPRNKKEFEPDYKMSKEHSSEKTLKLDKIIEKCNEAIKIGTKNKGLK